jgi:hypothetical protein
MQPSDYSDKSVDELRTLLREASSETEAPLISRALQEKRREELVKAAEDETASSPKRSGKANPKGCLLLVAVAIASTLSVVFVFVI